MDREQMSFEAIKMARELVINEYTNRRAQIHNDWVTRSNEVWKASKRWVPYPPIPPYPTELEIIEKAKNILDFLNIKIQDPTTSDDPLSKVDIKSDGADQPAVVEVTVMHEPNVAVTSTLLNQEGKIMEKAPRPPKPPEDDLPTPLTKVRPEIKIGYKEPAKPKLVKDLNEEDSSVGKILPNVMKLFRN